jgi:hypothetical protein
MGRDVSKLAVFILVVSSIGLLHVDLQAGEQQGFDAKRRAFREMMLTHGQEAFARGDVDKAGYYFQQAVEADPAQMAKAWFEGKGGEPGERIAPAVPQGAPVTVPDDEIEVIMGDDEGC